MKKLFIILSATLLIFAIGCQKNADKKAQTNQAPIVEAPKALEGVSVDMLAIDKCATCGMSFNEHAIVDTMTYDGKLYGFCSTSDKEKFKNDPEAALAKLDENQSDEMEE